MKIKHLNLLLTTLSLSMLLGCGNEAVTTNSSSDIYSETPDNNSVNTESSTTGENSTEISSENSEISTPNYGYSLINGDGSNNINQNHEAIGAWSDSYYNCMIANNERIFVSSNNSGYNNNGIFELSKSATSFETGLLQICYIDPDEYRTGAQAIGFYDENTLTAVTKDNEYESLRVVYNADTSEYITAFSGARYCFYKIPTREGTVSIDELTPYNTIIGTDYTLLHGITPKIVGEWFYYEKYKDYELIESVSSKSKEQLYEDHPIQFCRTSIINNTTEVLLEYNTNIEQITHVNFDEKGGYAYVIYNKVDYTYKTYYHNPEINEDVFLLDGTSTPEGINDGYLYLIHEYELKRILLTGGTPELVYSHDGYKFTASCNVNFSDDYIFLNCDGGELYTIPKDNIGATTNIYPYINLMSLSSYNAKRQAVNSGMWIWNNVIWLSHGVDYMKFSGLQISTVLNGEKEETTKYIEEDTPENDGNIIIPNLPSMNADYWLKDNLYMDGRTDTHISFTSSYMDNGVEVHNMHIDSPSLQGDSAAIIGMNNIAISTIDGYIDNECYYDEANQIIFINITSNEIANYFTTNIGVHIFTCDPQTGRDYLNSLR